MELIQLEKEKGRLMLQVEEADETLINLLISELLKNKDVEEAVCSKEGLQEGARMITVRMKKGLPLTAMKKAAEDLAEEFERCRELLQKELKSKSK